MFTDKLIWVIVLVLLQLGFILYAYLRLREQYIRIQAVLTFISLLVVLYVINRPINPAYKLAWSITILLIPIFGGLFYLLLSVNRTRQNFRNSVRAAVEESKTHFVQDPDVLEEIEEISKHAAPQANYIYNLAKYPVHKNTSVTYFSSGEELYATLLEELKKAEHFIFMEYFIIHNGIFWNSILDVLKKKAKQGVEIKIIYDDMGSIRTLPAGYSAALRSYGIECYEFNPFSPTLSLRLNNRDHRKITVIDGHTSFTGGINLADEYINKRQKLQGYWKDSGVMLKGEATWNFTVMFLQLWQHASGQPVDYEAYHTNSMDFPADCRNHSDGFVQPYADNPLFSEVVAENVYLNMIHRATKYIYITTPYLIVDNEMITALTLAAQSGIDVRIVTPRVPDKKTVFMITRSFYEPLTKAGVKIYEYVPGFIHSKMMVADDNYAVVGSINLDFRSLYLHFECATFLYHCREIHTIKKDILDTISVSEEMTYESCLQMNHPYRLWLSLLRLYAPLL
ncbi:MAG: cardiolipin synthase [Lachnospiraceae bacterium]|nr:cardiolipin synthase [Lachnospiraceae bacterium]